MIHTYCTHHGQDTPDSTVNIFLEQCWGTQTAVLDIITILLFWYSIWQICIFINIPGIWIKTSGPTSGALALT